MMTTVELYVKTEDDIIHLTYPDVYRIRILPGEVIHRDLEPDKMYLKLILGNDGSATFNLDSIIKMAVD